VACCFVWTICYHGKGVHSLAVLANRVLREIFGLKGNEVA